VSKPHGFDTPEAVDWFYVTTSLGMGV